MGRSSRGRTSLGAALGVGGLALALVAPPLEARVAALPARERQVRPPWSSGDTVIIGGTSMYEGRYGQARLVDLDEEPRPWPRQQAFRTVGRLFQVRVGTVGRTVEWTNQISTHALCGRRYCVAVTPAEGVAHPFSGAVRSWLGQRVEVVGAIDDLNKDPRRPPLWAFLVWSFTLAEDQGGDKGERPARSDLETLVTSPEARAGERISVKGVFRGANLFGDLPPGTQREPDDWVLRDGPFFIWVTGKRPRGSAFSLDPSSRSDCRWRLEVSGTVDEENGVVYLQANDVRLLGLAPPESRP